MKIEVLSGILSFFAFIFLLGISYIHFFLSSIFGLFFLFLLIGIILTISILMTNKVSKSNNSLKAKISFSFVLNLFIFLTIMFFWLIGSNVNYDEFGLATLFIIYIVGFFALLGFILGGAFSIKRKESRDFDYNLSLYFWILSILSFTLLIIYFYNPIVFNFAVSTETKSMCDLTFGLRDSCLLRIAINTVSESDCSSFYGDYRKKCYIWLSVNKKDIKLCIDNVESSTEVLKYNNYCSSAISMLEEENYVYNILKNPLDPDLLYALKSVHYSLGISDDESEFKYVPLLKKIVNEGSLDAKKESLEILFDWAGSKDFDERKLILKEEILPLIINQPDLSSYVDKINGILNSVVLPIY